MNNLTTEAGQANRTQKSALIDAINQVFALFRLNYHNQYLKAYSNIEELNHVKRLWLEMLSPFDANTIMLAAKAIIQHSEFLPTVRGMIAECEKQNPKFKIPDAHSAYIEACRAPSPKVNYDWSHPIVYHAGQAVDWYFLQSTPENRAYPIYKQKYEEMAARLREGENFSSPSRIQLEDKSESKPLDKEKSLEKLESLKQLFED